MKTVKKIVFILSVALCCVGCDQVTKEIAKQRLEGRAVISWGYDIFRLQYAENSGAWLSLGAEWPDGARFWIFIVLPGMVLSGLVLASAFTTRLNQKELFAFSLLIGGGLGNFLDRLGRQGHVIDFLNLGIGSLRTGIFNVADLLIMIGMGGLLLFHLSAHKDTQRLKGVKH